MTGEAHWITLALLGIVAAGVLALFFYKFRLDHRFRVILRRGRCPKSGEEVRLTMVQDVRTGEWTGVQTCSAFSPATAITCERSCVKSSNRQDGQANSQPAASAVGR